MSKNELMTTMSRNIHKIGFSLKKHSPEILVVAGAVGAVASAVMACKATLKVHEIVEEKDETLAEIQEAVENGENKAGSAYTEEDARKDVGKLYLQTGVKFAKLYGPAVLLGTLSITAMVSSSVILKKRNVAIMAAYTTLDKGFKEYRGRVVERFGKELDQELRYNIKAKEIEETVVKEDGTEETVKKTVNVIDPTSVSDYAVIYDDGCNGWTKDPELNKFFLKSQERYANDRLKAKGHLFLNEVYDMLGVPRTKAGQIVGWIYDEKHPNGDNFVDFGMLNINDTKKRDFMNGYERNIILDFNVDGPIYDLI